MSFDEFGDRMKAYEAVETSRRLDPANGPVYARIDGRGFSKFTRGLRRPYDERMSRAMIATTKALVTHTHASIGYTQSDEISLAWHLDGSNPLQQMFFDGKIMKLVSVLAGYATASFTHEVLRSEPEFAAYAAKLPHFDARVFQLPNLDEGANAFLWREMDATRNAVSMTAHSLFSHKQLHKQNVGHMLRMTAEAGVAFDEFPAFFRRGTFVRRELIERSLTPEELALIPAHHLPNINQVCIRSTMVELDVPPLRDVTNRVDVLFRGAEPVVAPKVTDNARTMLADA